MSAQRFTANGREYSLPSTPTVAITVDGWDPAYVEDALRRDLMPRVAAMVSAGGFFKIGVAHMPTFTNPNNLSIVTGVPPSGHGIAGNHFLGPEGEEVQLDDPAYLRAQTIHAATRRAGARALLVTTKEKLRRLLAHGGVPAISVEKASAARLPEYGVEDVPGLVGKPTPGIYDWEASAYALEIGLAVHRRAGLDLLYVSLTDFVQHKAAPGTELSDRFHRRLDELVGGYLDEGFVVGLTADHGMNAKQNPDGSPRVYYLEEVLTAAGVRGHRVILPITDPYVVHHGALGSLAWVHLPAEELERARRALSALAGVEEVYDRREAAVIYGNPQDRIGDLSVAADGRTALGRSRDVHDLSVLDGGLRSHGGRHEQLVPVMLSRGLSETHAARYAANVHNSDIHDLLLNGTG
jgi:phosphonoacetate hydrolase